MDVALIRKQFNQIPLEKLREYLVDYNYDSEQIKRMISAVIIQYMVVRLKFFLVDGYGEVFKIWQYNLKQGLLTSFDCPICRNKRYLG